MIQHTITVEKNINRDRYSFTFILLVLIMVGLGIAVPIRDHCITPNVFLMILLILLSDNSAISF